MRTVKVGKLHLPSGHAYCCDPFLSHEVSALETTVSPGSFDIEVCVATLADWGDRVALARLLLSTTNPVEWQKATFVVDGRQQSRFRVGAGMACFMDQQTRELFVRIVDKFYQTHPHGNYYDDVLAEEFKHNADPRNSYHSGDWALHSPVKSDLRNIALFASGLGDGMYSAYWGLDSTGKPAMLIADFNVIQP